MSYLEDPYYDHDLSFYNKIKGIRGPQWLMWDQKEKGYCRHCGKVIKKGRRRFYCSKACSYTFMIEHDRAWQNTILLDRQDNKCAHCGCIIELTKDEATYREIRDHHNRVNPEIDHKVALANGGVDCLFNLQILCHDCHVKKTMADFNWGPHREALLEQERVAAREKMTEFWAGFGVEL